MLAILIPPPFPPQFPERARGVTHKAKQYLRFPALQELADLMQQQHLRLCEPEVRLGLQISISVI